MAIERRERAWSGDDGFESRRFTIACDLSSLVGEGGRDKDPTLGRLPDLCKRPTMVDLKGFPGNIFVLR